METVGGFLQAVLKPRYEEDGVDRLNYKITSWLLLAASLTLSAKEYVGSPLQCWTPAQFQDGWTQYVHDYCLVENTYWLPFDDNIPDDPDHRDARMISYYQWVPFIMALMGLLFVLPHYFWRSLNSLSGIPVRALVNMGKDASEADPGEGREEKMRMVAVHLHDAVDMQGRLASGNPLAWLFFCVKGSGLYVSIIYILTKLIFIANLIVQYQILNYFLGPDHSFWGVEVLGDLIENRDWKGNGHFPRVTLCDFQVRVLGNVQRHTVQCVLMINMFNEKIFLFLWWWFALVFAATVYSIIRWAIVMFIPSFQESFIRKMLNAHGLPLDHNERKVHNFVRNILKSDGVFTLRLMAANAGDMTASMVVKTIWQTYVEEGQPVGLNNIGNFGEKKPLLEDPNHSHSS